MNRLFFILTIPLICWSELAFSQHTDKLYGRVENIIEAYRDSLGLPGISVAVIQNNKVEFKKSFGYANLEMNAGMTNSSVYRIWSISKQICAVSILKSELEGLLRLSDPVGKYLDSIPETWKDITIQQLLSHTSGIKDYLNDFPAGGPLFGRGFTEIADSASVLKFKPGNDWSYSNTGYWVLAKIAGKVSGKLYQDLLRDAFFIPLGMTSTGKMDYFRLIKNRVNGYQNVDGALQNSSRILDENYIAEGDGELISTLDDLTKWTQALFSGKIIDLPALEKAWKPAKYNNGEKVNASMIIFYEPTASYGTGWFISELEGHKIVWTPGAGLGSSTVIFSVPDIKLSIIVLCNDSRFLIADMLARRIAQRIITYK
ncbi:MAG: serine hydrolase domain-containing protein [Bacteroidales bacterium]